MLKDSFTKISNAEEINFTAIENSELFILQSPLIVDNNKIADR